MARQVMSILDLVDNEEYECIAFAISPKDRAIVVQSKIKDVRGFLHQVIAMAEQALEGDEIPKTPAVTRRYPPVSKEPITEFLEGINGKA